MGEKLAILDCGGQYTKVIDRKVRELGVKSEILSINADINEVRKYNAIILSGGPSSVYKNNAPTYDEKIFELNIPILGICYGFQLINHHFGGVINPGLITEYGQCEIDINNECELFAGLGKKETVLMSHGDSVEKIADGFECMAKTGDIIAAIYNKSKKIAAVQFHPEVELTENGMTILDNFLRKICNLKDVYALDDRIETSIKNIQKQVGNNNVIVLVSGGVDSMVSAVLLLKALPKEQIYAIHVDHGFMRKNESDLTCKNLEKLGFKNLLRVNAQKEFLNTSAEIADGVFSKPLCEVTEPEMKRQIIGRMFIDVTRKAAESLNLDFDKTFIAQGTLRPDLIESGNPDVSELANTIKTHHNDVDIIRKARKKGLIIETNYDWHKDEVRKVARMLGVDEEIASRQPFPGPGLAVRLICSGKDNQLNIDNENILKKFMADKNIGVNIKIAPVKSVGVQGDNRSYKNLSVLYGDGINGDFEQIYKTGVEVPNKFGFINRCVYVLDRENIEGELKCGSMYLTEETTDLLREVDYIVTSNVAASKAKIDQYFAVLLPIYAISNYSAEGELHADENKKFSVVIRMVKTSDYMTAKAVMPGKDIDLHVIRTIINQIKDKFSQIDLVMFDITGKPPSTVEWE